MVNAVRIEEQAMINSVKIVVVVENGAKRMVKPLIMKSIIEDAHILLIGT